MNVLKQIFKLVVGKLKHRQSSFSFHSNWDLHSTYGVNIYAGRNTMISSSTLEDDVIMEDGSSAHHSTLHRKVKLHTNAKMIKSELGSHSYVAAASIVANATIGKYCSIGPDVIIGYGIHPTNFISTSPVFYANSKNQTGFSYTKEQTFNEHAPIYIGNDVWIGARAVVLDGITIGDGAIIAAGAIVSKDVQPYSIVGGVPAKFIRNRFSEKTIQELIELKWWNYDDNVVADHLDAFRSELEPETSVRDLFKTRH